jgi:DNA-binding GntR family transcriptional regulator
VTNAQNASAPLYEMIYAVLREHIASGRFPRGLVLGEANVARAFKASRVPASAALRRLRDEGLVSQFEGRGYLTGAEGGDAVPIRLGLDEAGLRLPPLLEAKLTTRNRREHIYPDVEHAVAVCLAYGRFMLNESSLAEHYGVSRTVAHEVLTRLERTGIVTKDRNQRWYAGPLTAENIREHFEIRWLLEPTALRQAFPKLDRRELEKKRERVISAKTKPQPPAKLERIERDLHIDIIAQCDNALLFETVRRSQLPLIATHSTFHSYHRDQEIAIMLSEHLAVLDHLIAGNIDAAAAVLEAHIKRSLQPNTENCLRLGPLPPEKRPVYLTPVARR